MEPSPASIRNGVTIWQVRGTVEIGREDACRPRHDPSPSRQIFFFFDRCTLPRIRTYNPRMQVTVR